MSAWLMCVPRVRLLSGMTRGLLLTRPLERHPFETMYSRGRGLEP